MTKKILKDLQKNFKNRVDAKRNFILDEIPPFPRNMLLELSNSCNHKCVFCPTETSTRKRGRLNPLSVFEILKEAYNLGTREVGFYSTGEPLMDRKLEDYVQASTEIGYDYSYISTNGALAKIDRMKKLIDLGLKSIKFSINATNREDYKTIHKKDEFDLVIKNLKELSQYIKDEKKNVRLFVTSVVTNLNEGKDKELEDLVGENVEAILFMPFGIQSRIGLPPEISQQLKTKVESVPPKIPCQNPFNRLHVTWEGYLSACCTDYQNYLITADLSKMTLEEAWQSSHYKKLRKKHIEGNVEGTLCQSCAYGPEHKCAPITPEYATTMPEYSFHGPSENKTTVFAQN